MTDIEKSYTGWITVCQPLMMPKDEIVGTQTKVFIGEGHPDDGAYIVRLIKKTPTIEFVCKSKQEAEELSQWLKASRKVVELDFKK